MHTSLHQSTSGAARHVESHHSLPTFCSVPFSLGRQPAGLLAGLLAAGVTEGLAAGLSLGHMHTPLHQSASGVERHVLSHQSSATFWSVAGSTAHFCPSTAPPACSARAAARSLAASACAQAESSATARAVGRRSGICPPAVVAKTAQFCMQIGALELCECPQPEGGEAPRAPAASPTVSSTPYLVCGAPIVLSTAASIDSEAVSAPCGRSIAPWTVKRPERGVSRNEDEMNLVLRAVS